MPFWDVFNNLIQGSANCVAHRPNLSSCLLFKIKLFWHTVIPTQSCTIYGCLCAIMAELSSYNRGHMAHCWNIYCLVLHRTSLPASVLVLDCVPLLFFTCFCCVGLWTSRLIHLFIECLGNRFLATSPMLGVSCLYKELLQCTKVQRTVSAALLTWRRK